VQERPYSPSNSDFVKRSDGLKNRWEEAPKGRVFYFSNQKKRVLLPTAGSLLPVATGGGEGGDDPNHNNTDYMEADGGDFYVPGVADHSLDELRATSIAGNDISSSCLYATGIVATAAGIYAPFSSVLVVVVLYLFRKIYSEVFSALPMNGGTYNALLNTANKNMAALAAILSTLSYTATAVTSAASAGDYLNYEWEQVPSEWVCIGILIFFALLTLMGIQDSANTATALFIFHLATMATLVVGSLVFVIRDGGEILKKSWNSDSSLANPQGTVIANLFFGYCSALLGVTGFESSSNYIEEQRAGVFPKTLRNMWISITLINPPLAVLSMGVISIEELVTNANYSLAYVGNKAIGDWFRTVIVIDAAIVLSGAVLTAYVGITGLHRRLALDRIMPHFFLNVNEWRKSNHWIVISFCVLTCSLRLLVSDMNTLGGVYAIAFLGVMMLFCISNLLLKFRRGKLPRSPIAHPAVVIVAFAFVTAGVAGNMAKAPENAEWFLAYFSFFAVVVLATKFRVTVLRLLSSLMPGKYARAKESLQRKVHEIRNFPIVFFVKEASLHQLNKAITYIMENEDTKCIKIVHMSRSLPTSVGAGRGPTSIPTPNISPRAESLNHIGSPPVPQLTISKPVDEPERVRIEPNPNVMVNATDGAQLDILPLPVNTLHDAERKRLENWCTILDELYPKLTIDMLFVDDEFGPRSVLQLSEELGIPRNYMFMTCPSDKFNHTIGGLGGVRVIQH
jgi:amino acid transporter